MVYFPAGISGITAKEQATRSPRFVARFFLGNQMQRGYWRRMNETIEIQRLTKAIANLAQILVETTAARVQQQQTEPNPSVAPYVPKRIEPPMTKRDVAAYLKVSVRTVDNLIRRYRLPHIKFGRRCLRFMLADVENELKRRCNIGGL